MHTRRAWRNLGRDALDADGAAVALVEDVIAALEERRVLCLAVAQVFGVVYDAPYQGTNATLSRPQGANSWH